MSVTISLKEIRKAAKNTRLKVGDRVVFLPMGGIWSDLKWKTGVIIKKNEDSLWRFDVEIDLPHTLRAPEDHINGDDFIVCVGPGSIVPIRRIGKDKVNELNNGLGIASIEPELSRLLARRRIWNLICKMSHGKDRLAKNMIHKCDRSIARLQKSGGAKSSV